MYNLTIGIPTFMRNEAVSHNVSDMLADDFLARNRVELIVSDNGSTDGTIESICGLVGNSLNRSNIQVNSNSENLGVFENIFGLFDRAQSDYLLVTSDEDFVLKNHVPSLIDFLHEQQPTFVSPQFFIRGHLYRGKTKTRPIRFKEYEQSSFYTSGLVFNVQRTRSVIQERRSMFANPHLYYIQSLIVAELMLKFPQTQYFYACPVTHKKYSLPSHVSQIDGYRYSSVPGRWESFVAQDTYIKARLDDEIDGDKKHVLAILLHLNRTGLYDRIVHAMRIDRPEVEKDFRLGVLRREVGNNFIASCLALVTQVTRQARAFARRVSTSLSTRAE